MRHTLVHFLFATVLVGGIAGTQLKAQSTEIARIPFTFYANHRTMPAGKYWIEQQKNDSMLFQISDRAGHSIFLMAPEKPTSARTQTRLEFLCADNDCALLEIWTANGGFGLSKWSVASELTKRYFLAARIDVPLKPR